MMSRWLVKVLGEAASAMDDVEVYPRYSDADWKVEGFNRKMKASAS